MSTPATPDEMTGTAAAADRSSSVAEARRIVEDIDDQPETIIEARPGWKAIDFQELWKYRELVYFLTWRDIKVRYKQTALGAAWAIVQPLALMVIFTAVLGKRHGDSGSNIAYPVFVYSGLLIWLFFSQAILSAGNSLVMSKDLITKVYFPRLTIPISAIGPAFIDFLVAMSILVVMMIYYGIAPSVGLLFVPVLVLLAYLAALGAGAILASLNVSYRDFRYTLPFLVQIWMLATPSIYIDMYPPPDAAAATTVQSQGDEGTADAVAGDVESAVDENLVSDWLKLNPITPLVGSFRAAILGRPIPWGSLSYSTVVILVTCVAGCFYFRRSERSFADII